MSDEKKQKFREWVNPDYVKLDPNGPKLEVSGPILEPEPDDKPIHEAFMAKQSMITDVVAMSEATKLGWTKPQIEALLEIRHGRGFWC